MRSKYNNKLSYSFILLLILLIGIGYAALTSNLDIAGSTKISGNTWDIHFNNIQVTAGSIEATSPATINPTNNTSITYSIELDLPGDFYEFTVDIVNAGTIPGKINLVSNTGIDSQYQDIIEYEVKYTNGKNVLQNDILNAGFTKHIIVRIYYKEDIDNNDLPSSDIDLDMVLSITYTQSSIIENNASNLLQNLSNTESCISKYEGQVTDRVGVTETATNVYFDRCVDKRNVIFGGFCWQVIRTTETGGMKILYNGEPADGKCESTRGDHKGIVQSGNGTSQNIASSYLYGSSFTYNTTNNNFALIDTTSATWSDSTHENLIGKFTCKTNSDTCSTIYQINAYKSNTEAYLSYYTIADTNYAQIGKSSYNANDRSLAMVGYMFNRVYNYNTKSPETNTYKYGSTFTYANGTYTLSGTTQDISDWSTGYNTINNTHYTCWNDTGTCTTISYIYNTISSQAYYFNISGGKGVSDILGEMLSNNDVNRYNSSIKGIVDAWYAQNLSSKTSMLEDTVYCNARNITNYGGWNPDGVSYASSLRFKNYDHTTNLVCPNETDQFTVNNNKAKLTYPVALLQDEEKYNINTNSLMSTGANWWELSPYDFAQGGANVFNVFVGGVGYYHVYYAYGARPVVSLASDSIISSGTGSETDPWVVE